MILVTINLSRKLVKKFPGSKCSTLFKVKNIINLTTTFSPLCNPTWLCLVHDLRKTTQYSYRLKTLPGS